MKEKRGELVLSAYAYMASVTREMHGRYVIYLLIILFNQLLNTGLTVLFGKSIDILTGIITRFDLKDLLLAVLIVSVLRCFGAITESVYYIRKIVYDIETLIENHDLYKLFRFSLGQTDLVSTGEKMENLQKGTSSVSEMINLLTSTVVPTILQIITAISILFYMNWLIGLVVTLGITLFTLKSIWTNNRYVEPVRKARKLEAKVSERFWEMVKHLKLVIMTATQKKMSDKYFAQQKVAWDEGKRIWTRYNIENGLSRNLTFDHLLRAPFLAIIFYLVQQKEITIGDVSIIVALISTAYSAVGNIGTIQRSLLRHAVNIMRLKEMIEQPPLCADIDDSIELKNPKGLIEFNEVTFSYDGKTNALDNVSFTIKSGETVAFVGTSGSGKSTIISMLLRGHQPQSGCIKIDDIPLDEVAIDTWRQAVGVVSQNTMLWNDTVRQNITFSTKSEMGEGELMQIASASRIDEFFDRLGPDGLDTVIGENGTRLSGGQCQRIAIARVLARDPRVIIFDEATNALDNKTEAEVQGAIRNALKERTGIVIAHRLGTVRNADRIFVLEKGQIVGEGTFDELSQNNEAFKQLIGSELR